MMNKKISVTVPSTVNGNKKAPAALTAKWLKAAKVLMSQTFGGFTATPAVGGWVSDTLGLIEEKVTVVTSFTEKLTPAAVQQIEEFAREMAADMGQEAVSVEVNGELRFVEKTLQIAA